VACVTRRLPSNQEEWSGAGEVQVSEAAQSILHRAFQKASQAMSLKTANLRACPGPFSSFQNHQVLERWPSTRIGKISSVVEVTPYVGRGKSTLDFHSAAYPGTRDMITRLGMDAESCSRSDGN
jgi:hypothetical protein